MSLIASRGEMDIKPFVQRFRMAAALLLVAALACASQVRTRRLLEQTHGDLVRAESGLDRVRQASRERRHALTTLKAQYLPGDTHLSAERILYERIDDLKARFSPQEMNVSALERRGEEVSLQYSLKFVNPNYGDFLNTVGYLDGAVFPSSLVSAVEVTRVDVAGKAMLSCSVSGKLLSSAKGGP